MRELGRFMPVTEQISSGDVPAKHRPRSSLMRRLASNASPERQP
jgi:hypothetical protein